ncbi:MAG: 4-hydroxythreonine-4-phosphate dehydrogenase [Chitinophagales bacterium]|jgi:4-hydroxythreonine-4-phosphate dehydrogenase
MQDKKPKIGITIGDINGVGPEVIIKMLSNERIFQYCTPIIYGSTRVLSYYKKLLNNNTFRYSALNDWSKLMDKQANVVSTIEDEPEIQVGQETAIAGKYALDAIDKALEDWKEGKIDALLTAPISKNTVAKAAEGKFTGHTEYLAEKTGADDSLMILFADNLRMGLVTNHIPVSEISSKLTKIKVQNKIEQFSKSLVEDFFINKPKIAVLSLNPHAGDNGLLGSEELEILIPAINQSYRNGILALGPYAADGLFGSGNFKKFDGILAIYHDQGLAPFKALTFDEGVNFTAGLDLIRTSPDHGTAYDIAGKNIASERSMRQALFAAIDIFESRTEYKELTSDKLKRTKKRYKARKMD